MDTFSTQYRESNQIARRFARDAADGLIVPARKAALLAAMLLSELQDAGADDADLHELRKLLTDTFRNVQGRISTILDNEGLVDEQHRIDLSEVI